MAAFITANPLIVRVTPGSGLQSGNTTITWNTGSPGVLGRVYVQKDPSFTNPTPELLFDGDPRTGSLSNSTPPKTQSIRPGETYLFSLKQVSPPNTVLATVRVKGQGVFVDANAEPTELAGEGRPESIPETSTTSSMRGPTHRVRLREFSGPYHAKCPRFTAPSNCRALRSQHSRNSATVAPSSAHRPRRPAFQ
jgi:hypothetical protein